jgi:hypothetical protein
MAVSVMEVHSLAGFSSPHRPMRGRQREMPFGTRFDARDV